MANQFYYQIVNNTLYYGANQWEGATLLSEGGSSPGNYLFDLTTLTFTSILPHDDSIVVINGDRNRYLFNFNYDRNSKTFNILDFRNFTVIGEHGAFEISNDNYAGTITINELYFWDG